MYKASIASLAVAMLVGCGRHTAESGQPPTRWTTGFWFWQGSSAISRASVPVDALYIQAGDIHRGGPYNPKNWQVSNWLAENPPEAREYWLVYRFNEPGLPSREAVAVLLTTVREALTLARTRKLPVAGIQLDIDSPTRQLKEYAAFLKEVRAGLPSGVRLSITALLDWFRPGTEVASVVEHTDEFVPQFYDTGQSHGRVAIAAPVDAKKWGPLFERAGKPYRIGASSFGRAGLARPPSDVPEYGTYRIADLSPLEAALVPGIRMTSTSTPAGEMRLVYEVPKSLKEDWHYLSAGDRIEFVLPTTMSMKAAVSGARAMGPHCTGILFFRWPALGETMAAQPDQVLRAAGTLDRPVVVRLQQQDKGCAAVHCTDLFITDMEPLSGQPVRYTVRSSAELEYFMPAEKTPARMSGSDLIELSLPPFLGRSRIYVGRAVTAKPTAFRLEELAR